MVHICLTVGHTKICKRRQPETRREATGHSRNPEMLDGDQRRSHVDVRWMERQKDRRPGEKEMKSLQTGKAGG